MTAGAHSLVFSVHVFPSSTLPRPSHPVHYGLPSSPRDLLCRTFVCGGQRLSELSQILPPCSPTNVGLQPSRSSYTSYKDQAVPPSLILSISSAPHSLLLLSSHIASHPVTLSAIAIFQPQHVIRSTLRHLDQDWVSPSFHFLVKLLSRNSCNAKLVPQ